MLKFETTAGWDSEKGRVTWAICLPGAGDVIAELSDHLSEDEQEMYAKLLCGEDQ